MREVDVGSQSISTPLNSVLGGSTLSARGTGLVKALLRSELFVQPGFLPSPDNSVSLGALAWRGHHRWIGLPVVRGINRQHAIERHRRTLWRPMMIPPDLNRERAANSEIHESRPP